MVAVKIIGAAVRVVETPEFYIDEYAGNVGTKDDQLSIAVVRVAEPTAEVSLPEPRPSPPQPRLAALTSPALARPSRG